ncbi:MAG: LysR family transcriptional regulator [Kordiimonas sp.]
MHRMNWDDLRILESCARNGSFARASVDLGMSHTSISRRMTQLENTLNITLLHRTPAGITLTEAGLSIAAQASNMAETALSIKNTSDKNPQLSGRIKFETVDATAYNLLSHLRDFSDRYPDIEIDLRLNQELAALDRGDADVVLRATNDPTEEYIGHNVATHAFGVFGSAELINNYPTDTPLNDLPWILWSNGWTDGWMQELGLNPHVTMRCNTPYGIIQAMRAGMGIAHMSCNIAARDDRLLCLLAPDDRWALQIWLLTHQSMRRNQPVRLFAKFLRERLRANKALIGGKEGSATRPLNLPLR